MDTMSPYAVSLKNWPELPPGERIAAEVRYATELERLLGTPEDVCHAWWDDYGAIAEMDAILDEGTPHSNTPWVRAQASAASAGWRNLNGRPEETSFQMSIESQDGIQEDARRMGGSTSSGLSAAG